MQHDLADNLTRAAQESFDVAPEIDAAIQQRDLSLCYRLAPQVARLPFIDQVAIKTRVKTAFPQDFGIRDWDRLIKEAAEPAEPTRPDTPPPAPDTPDLLAYLLDDAGNAERIMALHGAGLRYCHALHRWLVWDGRRWAGDDIGRPEKLAKETELVYLGQALDKDLDVHVKFAKASLNHRNITSALASMECELPITPAELDTDQWILNCQNGTVDLHTGELRPHRREDFLTKLAPVPFEPGALAPRWEQFLAEVFQPHEDLIPFIQRAVGYSLTGCTREECLFLLHGTGRNGKGVLLKTLAAALGDYAGTADFSAFVERKNDTGPRDDIANMRGMRLVSAQESREGAALAERIVKALTGGDRVRARRLYENSSEFDPTWKIWLAANHKPTIKGTDTAIWSRLKLIPFAVSFDGREDKTLKATLETELPGILAWAVEGCLRWQEEGLAFPGSVVDATNEYRLESDQIGRYIDETCIVGLYASARARDLYSAYHKWGNGAGEDTMSEVAFARRLAERGLTKRKTVTGATYDGIGLRVEGAEPVLGD